MQKLYTKHRRLPSLGLFFLLLPILGCGREHPGPAQLAAEPWPDALEARYQEAEALRYAVARRRVAAEALSRLHAPPAEPMAPHRDP